ncbi:hypothetical protein FACS189421_06740 [Bacteroidia bacterium]|nr:hypothetical protein FACS189421_06740 [Bacteroidia bacterium]
MNENNPKISIIIPVWNGGKYLVAALESVAAQTFSDWECICVNNVSTDGSADVIREFSVRDPRFVLINNSENMGAVGGRNIGMDAARGEIFTFLDQDDLLQPRALEIYAFFADDPRRPDMIRGKCRLVSKDFAISTADADAALPDVRVQYFNNPRADFIKLASNRKRYSMWMYVWICCYRRDAVKDIRFDIRQSGGGGGEDNVFTGKVIDSIKSFIQFDAVVLNYRASPASQTHNGFQESLVNTYSMLVPVVYETFGGESDWHEFIRRWTAARMYRMCVKRTVLENMHIDKARSVLASIADYLPLMKKYLGWRRMLYIRLFMRGRIKLLRFSLHIL